MDVEAWYADTTQVRHLGLPIRVRRGGRGEGLLCLHGFPTSSWDFAPLWEALTARFDVVAPDLLGLGRSAKPQSALPVAMQADAMEAALVDAGIDAAHVLAHDLGDTVAQELLARQAEGSSRIAWRSVVLLNGGLFPETHRPRLIQRLLAAPVLGPWVARLSSERTFRRTMHRIFGPDTPPTEAFLRGSWELLESSGGRACLPYLIRYMQERVTHRQRWVQPLIDGVVPLRLVNGVLDPVSGGHMVDRFEQLVPQADVVRLQRLGHYPHVEDPDAVLQAFFAFHDRRPAAAGPHEP
ncbi:MAG: alpha/beta hydrolase [Myxococcales bacterium]|nr:alpha/beta hydrolase [Myxococcales bacterium]